MKIRIIYIDGSTVDTSIRISDRYAWEKKHNKSISEFEKNPALGDILWMAHRALQREEANLAPLEVWINQVEDFDIVESDPKS
jgi:hypothetical protein